MTSNPDKISIEWSFHGSSFYSHNPIFGVTLKREKNRDKPHGIKNVLQECFLS